MSQIKLTLTFNQVAIGNMPKEWTPVMLFYFPNFPETSYATYTFGYWNGKLWHLLDFDKKASRGTFTHWAYFIDQLPKSLA